MNRKQLLARLDAVAVNLSHIRASTADKMSYWVSFEDAKAIVEGALSLKCSEPLPREPLSERRKHQGRTNFHHD